MSSDDGDPKDAGESDQLEYNANYNSLIVGDGLNKSFGPDNVNYHPQYSSPSPVTLPSTQTDPSVTASGAGLGTGYGS
jgi:hypothetical protein